MKTSRKPGSPPTNSGYAMDAHHRVAISCILAALVGVLLRTHVSLPLLVVLSWDAFTLSSLVMAWYVIAAKDPYDARRSVRLQDASATFLFVLVISAATASLLSVALVLQSAKHLASTALAAHVAAATISVMLSWAFVHTIFALRYAHFYFFDAREVERHAISGGLIFPGKHSPGYMDFAYFSFVIGMTCQVSDVQISAPRMRRLALVHGLISFAFNTAILAMFVNIIAGLV